MNPVLSLILSLLVTQIKPADIAAVLAELASFLDPLIAKRGLVLRAVWFFVRSRLSSPSAVTDVQALLADIAGTPEVARSIASGDTLAVVRTFRN